MDNIIEFFWSEAAQTTTAAVGLLASIGAFLILRFSEAKYRATLQDLEVKTHREREQRLQQRRTESKRTEARQSDDDIQPKRTEARQPDNDIQGVLERLSETRVALKQQQSSASRLRLANTTLTAGQYIVGLGLTSSFLQDQLSPSIIGIIGLIVLISSTIQERYRPAVQYRGAMERILKLKVLIRQVEDDLHSFKLGREDAPDMLVVRRKISLALSDIDASEVRDLDTRLQSMEQPENPK